MFGGVGVDQGPPLLQDSGWTEPCRSLLEGFQFPTVVQQELEGLGVTLSWESGYLGSGWVHPSACCMASPHPIFCLKGEGWALAVALQQTAHLAHMRSWVQFPISAKEKRYSGQCVYL